MREDPRKKGARTIARLAGTAAVEFAALGNALCMDPGIPLRLPGFWDRVVVLLVGLILIVGLLVLMNGLRRRADRREPGD